jgi:hypothetical protein
MGVGTTCGRGGCGPTFPPGKNAPFSPFLLLPLRLSGFTQPPWINTATDAYRPPRQRAVLLVGALTCATASSSSSASLCATRGALSSTNRSLPTRPADVSGSSSTNRGLRHTRCMSHPAWRPPTITRSPRALKSLPACSPPCRTRLCRGAWPWLPWGQWQRTLRSIAHPPCTFHAPSACGTPPCHG